MARLPRPSALLLFQAELEALVHRFSHDVGPRNESGVPSEGQLLDSWILCTAWVDEDGDWTYTRLTSPRMAPHVRTGLLEMEYDEEE
jgi:hypothetical protein